MAAPRRLSARARGRRRLRARGDRGIDGPLRAGCRVGRRRDRDDWRSRQADHGSSVMCLAIPGQIVELVPGGHLATVEVSKVRRTINVDLLEPTPEPGEWVLIHVGFAMSRISGEQAAEQLRLLAMLGEDAQAMAELEGYRFENG